MVATSQQVLVGDKRTSSQLLFVLFFTNTKDKKYRNATLDNNIQYSPVIKWNKNINQITVSMKK